MAIEVVSDRVHRPLAHPAFARRRLGAVRFAESGVAVDAARLAALLTEASAQALFASRLVGERVSHRRVCARPAWRFDRVRLRAAQAEPSAIVAAGDDAAAHGAAPVNQGGTLGDRVRFGGGHAENPIPSGEDDSGA